MAQRPRVRSVMVEFHRFGPVIDIMKKGERYIRTTGYNERACQIELGLDHREFVRYLNKLRYKAGADDGDAPAAIDALSTEADEMLPDIQPGEDETVQIDLVAGAAELWAFPFEACRTEGVPRFANNTRRVVLTRRIRETFADQKTPWPTKPRVLFIHAPKISGLSPELIADHGAALKDALRDWCGGKDPDAKFLVVKELYSLTDLDEVRNENFTHIHILAHGEGIPDPEVPGEIQWGLRLGAEVAPPSAVAKALTSATILPVVVTIASCDSANQGNPALPTYSLAQELHRCGIPVVVASQLPLTEPGSVVLARHLYDPLLRGEDIRNALHDVRVKLRESANAGHDWLSLVAYVRLPERYADHLIEVALGTELALLKALQNRADGVIADSSRWNELDELERRLQQRISSLQGLLRALTSESHRLRQECEGLLASAHKRLAELLFLSSSRTPARAEEFRRLSRMALQTALDHYRNAFLSNHEMHWQGVQQVALEAALLGRFDPIDYTVIQRIAERALERDDKEYWALGTLTELCLLNAILGAPFDIEAARGKFELLKKRAGEDLFPVESTRRQLARYVQWWTNENGFFPQRVDLKQQADELLKSLT